MMVKPSVTELLNKATNRYELVIAASKRARRIANGEKALTNVNEKSAVTLAANEIAEGKVKIIAAQESGEVDKDKEENKEDDK